MSLGQTRGRRAASKVYVLKAYVPFSLAPNCAAELHEIDFYKYISKRFLQSEVLGEVSVSEGGSSGRSFSRSLRRGFSRKFRACFAGIFREKTSAKTSALDSHDSAQQNWRNFRENFMTRFCRGTMAKSTSCLGWPQREISIGIKYLRGSWW